MFILRNCLWLISFLLCTSEPNRLWAEPSRIFDEPWSVHPSHPTFRAEALPRQVTYPSRDIFTLAYKLWKDALSPIDGRRCFHLPSCSSFAAQAIGRYGLWVGSMMTLNRLLRGTQSSSVATLPETTCFKELCFIDQPADYAFWETNYDPMSGR